MELKTLKGIRNHGPGMQSLYSAMELREEAIKWIKEIESLCVMIDKKGKGSSCSSEIINWIKHFFNIEDIDKLRILNSGCLSQTKEEQK